ncbi:FAD-binding protein, partial [Chloroflexota bacterium]
MDIRTDHTDVLIIGAGMAGIRAAIEAADGDVNVTLVTKGAFCRDGAATWMAGEGYSVALYPPDSLEQQIKDTIKAGKFLNNQELVHNLINLFPQTVDELVRWGVRYDKVDDRFRLHFIPGQTYTRSLSRKSGFLGAEYKRVLYRQVKRRKRIKVYEDLFIIDLLKSGNTVVGAVGLDIREGEFIMILAKSTI